MLTAVPPPTLALAPGTACTAARTLSIVVYAAGLSGLLVSVPWRKTRPSLVTGRLTVSIPLVPRRALASRGAAAALPITSTGSPAPAGKCWARTASAVIDCGCPRNDCAVVSVPTLNPIRPSDAQASRTAVTDQTVRGRRAIMRPTRAQVPRLVGSSEPYFGRTG